MNQLFINAQLERPGLLRVSDLTPGLVPVTGHFYRLSLYRAGKTVLAAYTADASVREWVFRSTDYNLGASFPSGYYDIVLERMGPGTVRRTLANYFVRAAATRGERLWVETNGVWLDVTSDAVRGEATLEWRKLNTYDQYSRYQLRGSASQSAPEAVVVDVLQSDTYDNVNEPVVLSTGMHAMAFCRTEREAWARLVQTQVLHWQQTRPLPGARVVVQDTESKLQEMMATLTLLEHGLVSDAVSAEQLLVLLQAQLTTNGLSR